MKQAATGRQRARRQRYAAPPQIKAPTLIAAENSLIAPPGALIGCPAEQDPFYPLFDEKRQAIAVARLPGQRLYKAAPPQCADTGRRNL